MSDRTPQAVGDCHELLQEELGTYHGFASMQFV
jgi:hypothetical protein